MIEWKNHGIKATDAVQAAGNTVLALEEARSGAAQSFMAAVLQDVQLQKFVEGLHYGGGLKRTEAGGRTCLERLRGKQCRVDLQLSADQVSMDELRDPETHVCLPPQSDHESLWNVDGRPHDFVYQPYNIGLETIERLAALCSARGLHVLITGGSWWNAGSTSMIVISATEQ